MTDSFRRLTGRLKSIIKERSCGAALVGVAPVERFAGAPPGHGPRDFLPDAKSVVIIGLPIAAGLMGYGGYLTDSEIIGEEVDCTGASETASVWSPRRAVRNHIERRCCHESINTELQTLSMYGALVLEQAGYLSAYLPTSYGQTFSWPRNLRRELPGPPGEFAPFSHRHAAVAAGLGEFGLNNLVLTPRYGPRNRFVSVITTAGLVPDPLLKERVCLGERCSLCVRSCGGKALGEPFIFDLAGKECRLARLDKEACLKENETCYRKCLTACPAGRHPK